LKRERSDDTLTLTEGPFKESQTRGLEGGELIRKKGIRYLVLGQRKFLKEGRLMNTRKGGVSRKKLSGLLGLLK